MAGLTIKDRSQESGSTQATQPPAPQASGVGLKCPIPTCDARIAPTRELDHMEKHSKGLIPGEVSPEWLARNGEVHLQM